MSAKGQARREKTPNKEAPVIYSPGTLSKLFLTRSNDSRVYCQCIMHGTNLQYPGSCLDHPHAFDSLNVFLLSGNPASNVKTRLTVDNMKPLSMESAI
eukprot:jgi/Botrbrau1/14907/Bobra.0018s0012.1